MCEGDGGGGADREGGAMEDGRREELKAPPFQCHRSSNWLRGTKYLPTLFLRMNDAAGAEHSLLAAFSGSEGCPSSCRI